MKYGKLILIGLAAVIIASCSTDKKEESKGGWDITLHGKVGYPQPGGNITISEIRQDTITPVEDTIHVKSNYTFEKKIHLSEPGFYRIGFFGRQFVNVILDKSNVEINADGNEINGFFEVKGSPDMDMVMEVQNYVQRSQTTPEMQQLQSEFQIAASSQNEAKIKELQAKYQEILDKSYDSIALLIDKQPASLGLVNLLQNNSPLDKDKYYDIYTKAADKFRGTDWEKTFYGKSFIAFVDNMKLTAIGQPAPEISLPDPDGKIITLSSLKGKYILVDFWAKWCGPCRAENPNVVKAYNQFKSKGFDILSVSLDRSKADWLQAIKDDGLVWHHVSDLKYFESKAAADYNITAIPFSILVDPNGIIVAKNLRGAGLQKKLAEVLSK